jgi:hypothetical protein
MNPRLTAILIATWLGFFFVPWTHAGERSDMRDFFSVHICQKKSLGIETFWESKIFDAQIEGKFLTPQEIKGIDEVKLKELMKKRAAEFKHGGWAGEKCPDGSGWITTAPAPGAFLRVDKHTLKLDVAKVRPHCSEIKVEFADAAKSPAKLLRSNAGDKASEWSFNLAPYARGLISMTCFTKEDHIPRLWYLVPVKEGPLDNPPGFDKIKPKGGDAWKDDLLAWINVQRADEKLKPLKRTPNKDFSFLEPQMLEGTSVNHDPLALKAAAYVLDKKGIKLIGENKVKAMTTQRMAWLLWNSPSHRNLLLSEPAEEVLIAGKSVGKETLVSLLFLRWPKRN